MSQALLVDCGAHSEMRPSCVCQHLLAAVSERIVRGVNWLLDGDGNVNARCDDCEDFLQRHGAEWNDETEAFAKIKLICERCFVTLKETNPTKELT